MPTTKMPVWIRSEYVTIGQPPFPKIRGQKLPPVRGPTAYRYWQRPVPYGTGSILADLSYIVK